MGTGKEVEDASVDLTAGPSFVRPAVTDHNGVASISTAATGQYTAVVRRAGYIIDQVKMTVQKAETALYRVAMSPTISDDQVRIVLDWQARDITRVQLKLTTPNKCIVAHYNKRCEEKDLGTAAVMNYGKDSDSAQMSSMTITKPRNGIYEVQVELIHFKQKGQAEKRKQALLKSGARVVVYVSNSDRHYFNIGEHGKVKSGVWTVCKLKYAGSAEARNA